MVLQATTSGAMSVKILPTDGALVKAESIGPLSDLSQIGGFG